MEFLRSHIVAALVALFVLTGYGHDLYGDCDDHRQVAGAAEVHGTDGRATDHGGDCCECLCHQTVSFGVTERVVVGREPSAGEVRFSAYAEFPPEVEPLGIEHPPQLAS